jgi:hypothetical protein
MVDVWVTVAGWMWALYLALVAATACAVLLS